MVRIGCRVGIGQETTKNTGKKPNVCWVLNPLLSLSVHSHPPADTAGSTDEFGSIVSNSESTPNQPAFEPPILACPNPEGAEAHLLSGKGPDREVTGKAGLVIARDLRCPVASGGTVAGGAAPEKLPGVRTPTSTTFGSRSTVAELIPAAQFSFCNFCGHQVVGGNEETMLR